MNAFGWLVELPFLAVAALFTAYLGALAAAAVAARPRSPVAGTARTRFAVVVPAHNEAATLPALLTALEALDYPRARYEVIVIADNCEDDTAVVALAAGARVLTRADAARRSKGYALGWALELLLPERRHDAFVILDADSRPAPDLLARLGGAVEAGARVAQAYCAVGNARESWRTALMAADLALVHYLRPLGRQVLGGSADLQGNGICLTRAVLAAVPWQTGSLAEDREYHLELLARDIHATFVPGAVVDTVMEPTMTTARAQELRWEGGRLGLARAHLRPLLRMAWRRRSWARLDAALDLMTPPFALLAAGTALATAGRLTAWLWGGPGAPAVAWGSLLAVQAFYVFTGCALAGVPARAYAALFIYGPLYAAAKVWYCLLVLLGHARGWVPTPRRAVSREPAL